MLKLVTLTLTVSDFQMTISLTFATCTILAIDLVHSYDKSTPPLMTAIWHTLIRTEIPSW